MAVNPDQFLAIRRLVMQHKYLWRVQMALRFLLIVPGN